MERGQQMTIAESERLHTLLYIAKGDYDENEVSLGEPVPLPRG